MTGPQPDVTVPRASGSARARSAVSQTAVTAPAISRPWPPGRPRRRGHQPQVRPGRRGGDPAARRAGHQARPHQERLGDLLDGLRLPRRRRPPAWTGRPGRRRSAGPAPSARPGRAGPGRSRRPRTAPARPWPPPCVTTPSPRTSAKSRTRRSSRLAIRGVPRDRPAISSAPSSRSVTPEQAGRPADDHAQLGRLVEVQVRGEAEPVAQRRRQQARPGWWRRPA